MQQPAFWVALGKIMWINILLSGDNALVIAMACRGLPPRQRFWGMILGAGVAVFLRIIFTGIVVTLMELPYLKLVGGLALLVIAAKLLVPEHEDEDGVDVGVASVGGRADRGDRRYRDEPRQRDRGGRRRQWQRSAAGDRPCDQRSPDRRRCGPDHGAADALAASGMGRRRPAGLDRRRGDGDRSRGRAEAARAVPTARSASSSTRSSASIGLHFANGGHGGEVVCGIIGIIIVLVAGSIWRKRAQQKHAEHAAKAAWKRSDATRDFGFTAARSIRSGRPAAPVA